MAIRWPWSRSRPSTAPAPPVPSPAWLAQVGETIVALYAEELGRLPDERGRAALLHAALRGADAEALRASLQQSDEWQARHAAPPVVVVPDPPAPPTPTAPPGLVGQLRLDGDQVFRDDTGDVLPVLLHGGDLFSRWARGEHALVHDVLAQARAAGYHGIRAWTVLTGRYWQGLDVGPWTDGYAAKLLMFADALRGHGLCWAVSQGDLWRGLSGVERADVRDALRVLGESYPDVAVLFDAGNEAWSRGGDDTTPGPHGLSVWLTPLSHALPGHLFTLTAPPDGELRDQQQAYHIGPSSLVSVHGYRGGHWHDKIRHIFTTSYPGESGPPASRLLFQSEPFGPGALVSASDNKHELTPAVMEIAAVMSTCTRQLWTYFSSPGVRLDAPETFAQMPGFATTPAAVALLPRDVMCWPVITHGGRSSGWFRVTERSDEVRVDQVLSADGRAVAVAYGPRVQAHEQTRGTVTLRHEFRDETGLKGVLYVGEV